MQEINLLLQGLVLLAMVVGNLLWIVFLVRWARKKTHPRNLVPLQSQKQPFWTAAEFLIMFGALVVSGALLTGHHAEVWIMEHVIGSSDKDLTSLVHKLVLGSGSSLIAGGVTITWFFLINAKEMMAVKWLPKMTEIKHGLVAALWLLPPIGLISTLLSFLVPYEHQALDALKASPTLGTFGLVFFGTVIVAPIFEEFLFRVVLQGGLQRIIDEPKDRGVEVSIDGVRSWKPRSYIPIFISSAIFAAMHIGQGAAPIALFFLSAGLGLLYRQTGRVTAPIVVHMVLNGTTICVTFSDLVVEASKPVANIFGVAIQ